MKHFLSRFHKTPHFYTRSYPAMSYAYLLWTTLEHMNTNINMYLMTPDKYQYTGKSSKKLNDAIATKQWQKAAVI